MEYLLLSLSLAAAWKRSVSSFLLCLPHTVQHTPPPAYILLNAQRTHSLPAATDIHLWVRKTTPCWLTCLLLSQLNCSHSPPSSSDRVSCHGRKRRRREEEEIKEVDVKRNKSAEAETPDLHLLKHSLHEPKQEEGIVMNIVILNVTHKA